MMDTITRLQLLQRQHAGEGYGEAINEAIKALENQQKYEAALDMICNDYFDDMSRCPPEITVCKDEGLTCGRCIIEHYKKQAGLEGDE